MPLILYLLPDSKLLPAGLLPSPSTGTHGHSTLQPRPFPYVLRGRGIPINKHTKPAVINYPNV